MGFSGGSAVKNPPQCRSLGWEDPLEKKMTIYYGILAWEIYGERNLVGYSPWDGKELDMTE